MDNFVALKQFYEDLDAVAEVVKTLYGEWHPCALGGNKCEQCCHHSVFLVAENEAAYILEGLKELPRRKQREIRDRARANITKMRHEAGYISWAKLVQQLKASESVCPLLEDGGCLLYERRSSICRSYGMFIFDDTHGLYACPLVEDALRERIGEGVRLPNFSFVAKRQEEVLRGGVMPLSAWLEDC